MRKGGYLKCQRMRNEATNFLSLLSSSTHPINVDISVPPMISVNKARALSINGMDCSVATLPGLEFWPFKKENQDGRGGLKDGQNRSKRYLHVIFEIIYTCNYVLMYVVAKLRSLGVSQVMTRRCSTCNRSRRES